MQSAVQLQKTADEAREAELKRMAAEKAEAEAKAKAEVEAKAKAEVEAKAKAEAEAKAKAKTDAKAEQERQKEAADAKAAEKAAAEEAERVAQAHNINHIRERKLIADSIIKLQGYIKLKNKQLIIKEAPKIIRKLYKIKLINDANKIFFDDHFKQIRYKIKNFNEDVWRQVKKGVFQMSLDNFFKTPDNSVDKHILELWNNNTHKVSKDEKKQIMGEYIQTLARSSDGVNIYDGIKNQFCKLEGLPFLKDVYNMTVENMEGQTDFKKCDDITQET